MKTVILVWGRGGVCELFRVSFFGEWLDRAENVYLVSIEVF